MTDGYVHTHPITIVKNLSKVMYLLIIPVVRGMFYALSGEGLAVWLRGAWFDILVLMLIAGIAAVRWHRQIYRADKTGIYYKKGIIIRSEGFIPIDCISTMAVERVFWFKPIKAVILRADTNGGENTRFDFEIIARRRDAEAALDIRDRRYYSTKNLTKEFRPSSVYIAVLCAFMSNSFAGVVFAAALVSKAGDILGEKLQQRIFGTITELSQILAVGIPPFAAFVAIIILAGWFIGFVRNLLSHAKFKAVRMPCP